MSDRAGECSRPFPVTLADIAQIAERIFGPERERQNAIIEQFIDARPSDFTMEDLAAESQHQRTLEFLRAAHEFEFERAVLDAAATAIDRLRSMELHPTARVRERLELVEPVPVPGRSFPSDNRTGSFPRCLPSSRPGRGGVESLAMGRTLRGRRLATVARRLAGLWTVVGGSRGR